MRKHAKVSAVRLGRQLVIVCPHCRALHYHGAIGPEFGRGDGPRSPHCVRGPAARGDYSHTLREVTARVFMARQLRRLGFNAEQIAELLERVTAASKQDSVG
jgi:hypothetical protein